MDLGAPSSYLALGEGTTVYSSDDRELGKVDHVLAAPRVDIFDGIVIDTSVLPGGHRFVDAPQVAEIYERGVVLKVTAAEAKNLPEPSENPATMRANPGEEPDSELERKLRSAWDRIIGRG